MRLTLNGARMSFLGLAVVATADCSGTSGSITPDSTDAAAVSPNQASASGQGGSGSGVGMGDNEGSGKGGSGGAAEASPDDAAEGGSDSSVAGDTGQGGGPDGAADSGSHGGTPDSGTDSGGSNGGGQDAGVADAGKPVCLRAVASACDATETCCGSVCCDMAQICCPVPRILADRRSTTPTVAPIVSFTCVTSDSGACPPPIITCGGGASLVICPQ